MMCQGSRSMSRILRLSLLFLLSVLSLGSCASVGKPKDPADTLLIIPVDWTVKGVNASSSNWIWYYELEFAGIAKPVAVMPTGKHYVAVSGLPAGQHQITRVSLMPIANSRYRDNKIYKQKAPRATIVTREGAATMTSFCLDTTLDEVKANWFTQSYDFRTLTAADIERVRAELGGEGDFLAWEDALPQ
jgi:hypothetical protein